jgi:hypothetical protein
MKLLGSRSSDFQFLNYSRVQRNFTLIGATLLVKRSNLANNFWVMYTFGSLQYYSSYCNNQNSQVKSIIMQRQRERRERAIQQPRNLVFPPEATNFRLNRKNYSELKSVFVCFVLVVNFLTVISYKQIINCFFQTLLQWKLQRITHEYNGPYKLFFGEWHQIYSSELENCPCNELFRPDTVLLVKFLTGTGGTQRLLTQSPLKLRLNIFVISESYVV